MLLLIQQLYLTMIASSPQLGGYNFIGMSSTKVSIQDWPATREKQKPNNCQLPPYPSFDKMLNNN